MTDSTPATAALALVREEGARLMLDALIATGVIYLDVPNQAVRTGSPIGIELLDKELALRGLHRGQ